MLIDRETLKDKFSEQVAAATVTACGSIAMLLVGVTPLGSRGAARIAQFAKSADVSWLTDLIQVSALLIAASLVVLGALIYQAGAKGKAFRRAWSDSADAASGLIPIVCGPAIVIEKSTRAYVGKNGNDDTLECQLVLQRSPATVGAVRGWKLKLSSTSDLWLTGRRRRVPFLEAEQGGAVALLVNAHPKEPEWLLLLQQPLGDSPTTLRFKMNFPGFWNELRSNGEDFFRYQRGEHESDARLYKTEIRIPTTVGEFNWRDKPLSNNVKLTRAMDPQKAEQILTLEIANPNAGAEYWISKSTS